MEAANIKSIKRPLFTITLAMGSERVIVDNEDAVPDELTTVKSSIAPDKKAIAAKLKEIREYNEAVRKRMAAGEDAEHELLTCRRASPGHAVRCWQPITSLWSTLTPAAARA